MPNIIPVSDLRNYNEVLRKIDVGQPVFLTKNGRGRYAVLDIREYEKTQATLKLLSELAKGEKSGLENGWLNEDEVETYLGIAVTRCRMEEAEAPESYAIAAAFSVLFCC